MYDHFKKYSGVPVYFKTSRDKLQPWTHVLEKKSPISPLLCCFRKCFHCIDNPNTERGQEVNFPGGYSPAIPTRVCGAAGFVILGLLIVRVFS